MLEDKNIDRLFQEKLKDMEVAPSPEIWNAIEKKLQKKKRRIVPFWWLSIGSAACILVGVILFWKNTNNNIIDDNNSFPVITEGFESSEKQIEIEKHEEILIPNTEAEKISVKKELQKDEKRNQSIVVNSSKKENTSSKAAIITSVIENRILINDSISVLDKNKNKVIDELKFVDKQNNVNNNDFIVEKNDYIPLKEKIALEEKKQLVLNDEKEELNKEEKKDFVAEMSKKKEVDEIDEGNIIEKWKINPVIGILKSNSFSDTSPVDESLNSTNFSGENNIAFGVNVEYKVDNKWSFKSGVQLQKSSFSSDNIVALTQNDILSYSFVDVIPTLVNTENQVSNDNDIPTTIDNPSIVDNPIAEVPEDELDSNERINNLRQVYSYIEVPMEVKYTFYKTKRIQISALAGFSALFLNENQIINASGNSEEVIGELTNLNPVNFSGNLGVDFDLLLFDKLHFNINPMFKTQINTFKNNTTNFQPYIIGVYSGLKYQF